MLLGPPEHSSQGGRRRFEPGRPLHRFPLGEVVRARHFRTGLGPRLWRFCGCFAATSCGQRRCALARSAIYIDKGVSIYIRPGSPFWQLRISRYGSRARESLNTTDVEAAKAIARKRADELLSHAEGVVIPRNVTYKDLMTVYKEHAELRNTESTRKLNLD